MRREDEIELWQAADLLEMEEEALGKLAAERNLTIRRRGDAVFFLHREIEEIYWRQHEEILAEQDSEERATSINSGNE